MHMKGANFYQPFSRSREEFSDADLCWRNINHGSAVGFPAEKCGSPCRPIERYLGPFSPRLPLKVAEGDQLASYTRLYALTLPTSIPREPRRHGAITIRNMGAMEQPFLFALTLHTGDAGLLGYRDLG